MKTRHLLLIAAMCVALANIGNAFALMQGGASAIIQAGSSTAITATAPGATLLVSGVPGNSIYITRWGVTVGTTTATAQTVQIVRGTGTTCLTGRVALTGAYTGGTLSTSVGDNLPTVVLEGSGLGLIHVAPDNTDVCIVTTGSQAVAGSISWSRF